MIKTSTPSNTAEILSRYRPIAPRPDQAEPRQSPFMRNVWPQLQARPSRTRKRAGRTGSTLSPPVFKRQRLQSRLLRQDSRIIEMATLQQVTLPLLVCGEEGHAAVPHDRVVPEEKDLLQQLQRPICASNVISPKPVRPVGSIIRVERVNSIANERLGPISIIPKTRAEVEEEVEMEEGPVVVSDSRNRVRMANSAYKEMVGQPECSWLGGGRRIGGEVMIQLSGLDLDLDSGKGFSCWVKIEWGNEEKKKKKKSCANALCDVSRVVCESKDYEFAWRIRTQTRETAASLSSSTSA